MNPEATDVALTPVMPPQDSIARVLEAHVAVELTTTAIEPHEASREDHWSEALDFRKRFPRLPSLPLPPADEGTTTLAQALQARLSTRSFDGSRQLLLPIIGAVLDRAVHAVEAGEERGHRPYPSAGARYPVEVYLLARSVEGLAPGVYYYDGHEHELVPLLEGGTDDLGTIFCDVAVSDAQAVVVLAAAIYRSCLKYGGRGYRYPLLEAGAAAQCIDLSCREYGLGVCWLGGFSDRLLHELLDVSWELEMEAPVLAMAVGVVPS